MINRLFYAFIIGGWLHCASALFRSPSTAVFPLHRLQREELAAQSTPTKHRLQLRKSYGKVSIQCKDGAAVQISDTGQKVCVKSTKSSGWRKDPDVISCEGVFGIYKLPAGSFLAIIKRADAVSDVPLPGLKEIKEIQLVKIPSVSNRHLHPEWANETHISSEQAQAEATLMNAFQQHTLYYADSDYDLTRTYQSNMLHSSKPAESSKVDWTRVEEKFCWNMNAIAPFLEANCTSFVTPVVNAYIATTNMTHNQKPYKVTLISRRSRRRQGPRYIKRGSDELGDVANFVETEQIVHKEDHSAVSSFMQVRGSIPLFWSQPADWKLRPPVLLQHHSIGNNNSNDKDDKNDKEQASALKTHLCDMVSTYFAPLWGPITNNSNNTRAHGSSKPPSSHTTTSPKHSVYMINLIDKKGVQGKLGSLWHRVFQGLDSAKAKVFPRYGYFSNAIRGDSSENSATGAGVKGEANEADQDRDVTSHHTMQFNVTLSDLLALQNQRDQTGALVHEELTPDYTSSSINNSTTMSIDTHLVWFDYHHKCKCNAAATVEIYQTIQSALNTGEGFCVYTKNQSIPNSTKQSTKSAPATAPTTTGNSIISMKSLHTQKHIIRTNCMDCLDRTNVMQSIISRWVLVRQLASLESVTAAVNEKEEKITTAQLKADLNKDLTLPDKKIESGFRRIWTENGDYLSLLYAGSRAMKRDVTRGGRRTQRGAMDDAVAGARRYFMNNLKDSQKQLGIDLLLGLAEYHTLQDINNNVSGDSDRSEDDTNSSTVKINEDTVSKQRKLFQYAPRGLRLARIKQLLHSGVFTPLIPDATLSATSTHTHSKNTTLPRLPSMRKSGAVEDLTSDNSIAEEPAPDIMSSSSPVITITNHSTTTRIIDVNGARKDASKESVMGQISSIDAVLTEMLHDISTAEAIEALQIQRVKKVKKE
eukprot:gene17612-20065_t